MYTVEEYNLPMILSAPTMGDDEFDAYCERYPDCRLESTAEGVLIIMPPTGAETGDRNSEITTQLNTWSRGKGGLAPDSSAGLKLPNGSRRSPGASWISHERRRSGRRPEFIIELVSPSDRLRVVREKIYECIDSGVELG